MTTATPHIALAPERCDGCGRCVPACARGALKVGGGYIYVDTSSCDGCLRCVSACGRGAIRRGSGKALLAQRAGDGARIVVGSRAEAKALRRTAEDAERVRARRESVVQWEARVGRTAAGLDAADAREGRVPWGMADAMVVLGVMTASILVSSLAAGSQGFALMPPAGRALARSAILVVFFVVQMTTMSVLARARGATVRSAFGLGSLSRSAGPVMATAGSVVALVIATRLAAYAWGVLARALGWGPPEAGGLTGVFGGGGLGLALALVALVVLAPVAEELAFRGVLLRAFGAKWGQWPAIAGTAAVFALYHMTAWTFVPLFVLGLALGWVAWSRRSLWAAISLHAAYNGVVVAAAYWLAR